MRTLSVLAFAALAFAGCSDSPDAAPADPQQPAGDTSSQAPGAGVGAAASNATGNATGQPQVVVDEPFTLEGGQSASWTVSPAWNRSVIINIEVGQGIYQDLGLSGPGDCVNADVRSGTHVEANGSGVHLGNVRDGDIDCGVVPAGEHTVTLELGQGTVSGSISVTLA